MEDVLDLSPSGRQVLAVALFAANDALWGMTEGVPMPLIECRIPISPTPAFLNRVRLIAASLRQWYPDTIVRVSVGGGLHGNWPDGEIPPFLVDREFGDVSWEMIEWRDFNRWAGTRSPYLATVMDTWKPPFYGDYILHLDADVIPIRPFHEWFDEGSLCGVQAHVPSLSNETWDILFPKFGVRARHLRAEYTGSGIMCPPDTFGPLYYNSGVVFGRRELFERIAEPTLEAIDFLSKHFDDSYWYDQWALALGIAAAGVPAETFPLRYNFPNRPAFDRAHPDEVANMVFCHAMDTSLLDRDKDFESREALESMCARADLEGSNEVLRERIASLLPSVFG